MGTGRIAVAVSSCLTGERVRYDGRDKRHDGVCDELARLFELVPVCPEVAIGLGVPRPPIRLVRTAAGIRARSVDDPAHDVTAALTEYARLTAERLEGLISGYVFKRGSPSCGLRGVAVAGERGDSAGTGAGIFAAVLASRLPELPVVEEEALANPSQRQNFIERVRVYHRDRRSAADASIQARGGGAE